MDFDALAEELRRVTVEVNSTDGVVGAGVVWAPGLIVTAAHVIQRPRVVVRSADDKQTEGYVIAHDRHADLAVLRAPDLGLPPAISADSEMVRVGSLIIAIGHPFGMRGALTAGIVHAVGPITSGGRSWIQADLRLAPGNSGGPLADARGRLLGLNAMIVGGLAFAIPVSEVRRFVIAAGARSA
jgi:serine protease Do